jgi:dodecin
MSDHIYKMIEIVGSSKIGTDDAIANAIARAGKTLHNMDWFQVQEVRGHIVDGKVGHYQVTVKIGFRLE